MDCQEGLVCFQRNDFTEVPSCSCGESDESFNDYCVLEGDPPLIDTDDLPLSVCEGDCDTNLDCLPGLVCYQRDAGEAVPGCVGGEEDASNNDYCVKAMFAKPPTTTPTESPTERPNDQPTIPPMTDVPTEPIATTFGPTPNTVQPTTSPTKSPSDPLCVIETNDFPLALCRGDCDNDVCILYFRMFLTCNTTHLHRC